MRTLPPRGQLPGIRVPERGQDPYWDPGSEERMPDFRAFGGGGGGALASLRTGSGAAIWWSRHTKGGMSLTFLPNSAFYSTFPTFCVSFSLI